MEMTIGANIKRLRIAKNTTQEQLSVAMNVSCAAVSKWERGETYPDITLLQPLAYYFGVTLDELMGYDQEKIQAKINDVIMLYRKYWNSDYKKAREIIVKAYHDYPNDYWIMHYYMWNLGGDMSDNDHSVLIKYKDEFLSICEKILDGCTEEELRLNAWNMRAKIFHAEGKTKEALEIYRTKFTSWYSTCGQKTEQLFAKDTKEYYFYVQKNMYELVDLAADKLGRTVFFNPSLSIHEKAQNALRHTDLMLKAFEETHDDFFLMLADSFISRMENDLVYRGGTDDDVIKAVDQRLYVAKLLSKQMEANEPLRNSYTERRDTQDDPFKRVMSLYLNAKGGRRAELLKNHDFKSVFDKYK